MPQAAEPDNGDAPAGFRYKDGVLSWRNGAMEIRDEDVIAVISTRGGSAEYTIFSLENEPWKPTSVATEEKQYPFKLRATNAMLLPEAFLSAFLFSGWPDYVTDAQDVYVLISTLAGTELAVPFWEEILHPLFRTLGFEDSRYSVIKTRDAGSVAELTKCNLMEGANEGKKQTVVVLSGDGGIVDTINALGSRVRSRYVVCEGSLEFAPEK